METVKKVIQTYIQGTKTGDTKLLKSVFHEKAILSGDLGPQKLVGESPEIFFRDIEGYKAPETYQAVIGEITITGEIASATIEERGLKNANFVNVFHLQQIDGEWKIISKLFTTL